jgi:Listeria-Bacteroides repeat domain (List_Bact_rpt).
MKSRSFIFAAICLVLAATVITSCSKDEEMTNENGDMAVQFAFDGIAAVQTKSSAAGDKWVAGDRIGIYMMPNTAGIAAAAYTNIAYKATDDDVATSGFDPVDASKTIYYPQTGTSDFIAYYPYKATGAGADEINNNLFPVNTAVQTDPAAIDLLYSDNVTNKARSKTDPAALQFRHALSKITLNVVKGNGMAGIDFTGMTVNIEGFNTTTTFDLGTTAWGTLANPAAIIAHTTTAGQAYDAIVIPQTTQGTAKVTFTVGGVPYAWNMGTHTFNAGEEYVFTVTVNETSVGVTGQIIPWDAQTLVTGTADPVYTVTYNTNGGTGTQPVSQAVAGGQITLSSATELTPPAGKTFAGWNTSANGKRLFYAAGATFTLTANTILYAMWSGDGTAGNPKMIANATELAAISSSLDKDYILINDIDAGSSWNPIGGSSNEYVGTFNGNGHTVTIGGLNGNPEYAGLFAAIIHPGIVENLAVTATISTTANNSVAGCIVGSFQTGRIRNCFSTGSVTTTYNNGTSGGIAGYNNGGVIENCYSTATIVSIYSNGVAGGIVGVHNNGIVRNCVGLNGSITCDRKGRVAGVGDASYVNNYGSSAMTGDPWTPNLSGKSGADCDVKPTETWWKTVANWNTSPGFAWDFTNTWEMGADGYPKLRR